MAISIELAESILDLSGYLNTGLLPNPRNYKPEALAQALDQADKPRLATIYATIATTAARIAEELRESQK